MAYSVTYPSTVILALKDLINCSCCCHCAALTKVKRRPEVGLNMSCGYHLFLFIFPLSLSLSPSPSLSAWLKCFRRVVPQSIYSTAHCNMLWRDWIGPGGWLQDVLDGFSAWDGQLVKWTADCEQSGLSLLTAIQYTKRFICILLAWH